MKAWVWGAVAGTAALLAIVEPMAAMTADPIALAPGTPFRQQLEAGDRHVYRVGPAAGARRLVLRQHGVNVVATRILPSGELLGPFDSPNYRQGAEAVLLPAGEGYGDVMVEIAGSTPREAGRYTLVLEDLPESAVAAESAASAAGLSHAAGDHESALEHYRRALSLWPPEDVAGEARAREALALLLRNDRPREAAELYRKAASSWRALDEKELTATTLNRLALALDKLGRSTEGPELFRRAMALWQELGDRPREVNVQKNLCYAMQRQGEFEASRVCYERVIRIFQELGDVDREIGAKANAAGVYWKLGRPGLARSLYEEVLEWAQDRGNLFSEGLVLHNRALLLAELGEVEEAILDEHRALELFRRIEDRGREGMVTSQLGHVHLSLGECRRARSFLEQALALRRAVQDQRGEATAWRLLGRSSACLEEWDEALDAYGRALELSRKLEDVRGEADVYRRIGEAHAAQGSLRRAAVELERAAALEREIGDRRQEAQAWLELGKVRRQMNEPEKAVADIERALKIFRGIRDRGEEARALEARARTLRDLGRSQDALADLRTAADLLADLRTRVGGLRQRAGFLAGRRGVYDLYIELLMERHRAAPRAGWDRRAFAISERARSRTLLDVLRADDRSLGEAQRRALREAAQRLAAVTGHQIRLLSREHDEAAAAVADREVFAALGALERLRAELRPPASDDPGGESSDIELSVEQAQRLLDPGTLLAAFFLAEEKSFVWAVGHDSFATFELPARSQVEALARRTHEDLSSLDLRTGRTPRQARTRLGRLLLTALAEPLDRTERLAVVADGALNYVPFAALPREEGGAPLIATHEIVSLPSATALALQRVRGTERTSERKIAIFADPVFGAAASSGEAGSEESLLRAGLGDLAPLPSTRVEARAIAALFVPRERFLALGLDAHRGRVTSGELASYRYVHFATHGLNNARHPDLSGIVLSQIDMDGTPRHGFLSLDDLYDLELDAELVVLSGCRTALGREVRGEGLLGLGRGFMAAGASRVVASLWSVQDEATAELMTRFYRAMLEEDQSPAAALAAAGRSIREKRRWSDPYFWAAFVLVGDWRS